MLKDESYDEKVDIWSLGIVFYILITSRNPLANKNDDLMRNNIKDRLIERFKYMPKNELIDFKCPEFSSF